MSIQRIYANNTNDVKDAAILATNVLASSSVWQNSAERQGNGTLELKGNYTGFDDALFDIEITGVSGKGRTSTPIFAGAGSGSILNLNAGTLNPQTISITLKDMGTPTQSASIEFFGSMIKAKAAGSIGNAINITVDRSNIVKSAVKYSLFREIQANQSNLSGSENNFGAMVLNGNGEMNSASPRLVFGDDPQVFRQFKRYVNNDWEYVITPAAPRYIKASTKVYEITGNYSVTVTDGSVSEAYNNIVTLYDLLSALSVSALVEVVGAVTKDMQPGGMAVLELPLRTDAYHLPIEKAGNYLTDLNDFEMAATAPTEMLNIECMDNTILGSEIWKVEGSASGLLKSAQTNAAYSDRGYQFIIPEKLPQVVFSNIKSPNGIQITNTAFISRNEGVQEPELGIKMGTLGKAGFAGQLTAKWTKYVKTVDCDWRDSAVSGSINSQFLGIQEGGAIMALDPAYKSRLEALYDWKKSFIYRNSRLHVINAGSPEIPYQPAKPEQLAVPEVPYIPATSYQAAQPEQLYQAAQTVTRVTPIVHIVLNQSGNSTPITLTIPPEEPIVTVDFGTAYNCNNDTALTSNTIFNHMKNVSSADPDDMQLVEFLMYMMPNEFRSYLFMDVRLTRNLSYSEASPGVYNIYGSVTISRGMESQNVGFVPVSKYLSDTGFNTLIESHNYELTVLPGDISADDENTIYGTNYTANLKLKKFIYSSIVNHVPVSYTIPEVPYRAATPEIPYSPGQAYRAAIPYRAATPEIPYQPAVPPAYDSAQISTEDLDWFNTHFDILIESLGKIYTNVNALALWDELKTEVYTDIENFDAIGFAGSRNATDLLSAYPYKGELLTDSKGITERYKARVDLILLAAGIVPGKSDGSSGGAGIWSDMQTDYWQLEGGYLPFYNNVIGYSAKKDADGNPYSTMEFAFAIACKCPNLLKYGDTITISFAASSQSGSSGKTYQPGDYFRIPVIAASPVNLVGGIDGNDTITWGINGTANSFPDYQVINNTPQTYSDVATGLSFNMQLGGIPFALGDSFIFDVEGGTFHWRKNSGAWSADLPISDTSIADGLTATFSAGAAPSFVPGDFFSFDAKQPASPSNIQNLKHDKLWKFIGTGAVAIACNAVNISSLCIVHDLPVGTVITLSTPFFGVSAITTDDKHISIIEGETQQLSALDITFTPPQITDECKIMYIYAGNPLTTENVPNEMKIIRKWDMLRGSKANFGGSYLSQGVSGAIGWNGFISKEEVDNHVDMIDYVKRNSDEPVVMLPHYLHTEEAFLCRIAVDSVEVTDMMQYQPDDSSRRVLSLNIPFEPVMR